MEALQTLYVKNMVCPRCILTVGNIFNNLQISLMNIKLGKVLLKQQLQRHQYDELNKALGNVGLELIESRVSRIIEDAKQAVREYIEEGLDGQRFKLSTFIAAKLHYDFGYVSDMFSAAEGITLERYFLLQRIEKAKQLIQENEHSFSQVAYELGFSSVHHLSAQFKKLTGYTPTQFKQLQSGNSQLN